jgi:hypothetical protein
MGIAFSLGEAVLSSSPRKDILKILRIIAGAGLSIGSLNFAEIIKSAQVIAVSTGKRKGMTLFEIFIGAVAMKVLERGSVKGWLK